MAMAHNREKTDETPEIAAAHQVVSRQGQMARRLKNEYKAHPAPPALPLLSSTNGYSTPRPVTPSPPSSNSDNTGPTAALLAYLNETNPRVGDVIPLGDLRVHAHHSSVTPQAWGQPFRATKQGNSALERAGWRFEVVNGGKITNFCVKVIAAPQSEEDKMQAALDAIRQETERRIAEVMRQFGR